MSVPVESGGSLPPYLSAAFQEAANRALELSRQPYTPYPGQRTAPQPPSLRTSAELSRRTGTYHPSLTASETYLNEGVRRFPGRHEPYMVPYTEGVTGKIAAHGRHTAAEKLIPELRKRFEKGGPHGSRHTGMTAKAAAGIERDIGNFERQSKSKAYQHAMHAFNEDRSRELKTSNLMRNLGIYAQAGNLTDIEALRNAGILEQDQQQRLRDFDYEQWLERRRHPYEALEQYFSILRGTPYVPSTYRRADVPYPSQTMHTGDWSRLALNALENLVQGGSQSSAASAPAQQAPAGPLSGINGFSPEFLEFARSRGTSPEQSAELLLHQVLSSQGGRHR